MKKNTSNEKVEFAIKALEGIKEELYRALHNSQFYYVSNAILDIELVIKILK